MSSHTYDEMTGQDGGIRAHYSAFSDWLDNTDSARITQLRQNATIFYRNVRSYFPKSTFTDTLRFFALPGEGTVRDESFALEEQAVVLGDLYFKSPTLRWEKGPYRFVFDHEKARAELPIRLE